MRRTASVLLLPLTATVAQAGKGDFSGLDMFRYVVGVCTIGPLLFVVGIVITHAIRDWRKARRPTPPSDPPATE